ncbi:MAG: serine/threonine-protein kinase [Myxococcota bacterium]
MRYAAPMRPVPGQTFGAYVLSHRLGKGGMAEVWAATSPDRSAHVAVKLLTRAGDTLRARLRREGQAQSQLTHPNLLPVFETLEQDGVLGLVMPLVRGPSLDTLLKERRLTEAEAVAVFRAVVSGVGAAHEQTLIHRDLKPGNVLLDQQGQTFVPRVADFGLVKDTGAAGLTRTGAIMGTLNYAAPEQMLDASKVDHRADLFSLGVLFLELLTGRRPFRARAMGELLMEYMSGPALDDAPRRWWPLCTSLVAVDAVNRPASCAVVLRQLGPPASTDPLSVLGPFGQAASQAIRRARSVETLGTAVDGSGDTWASLQPFDSRADTFSATSEVTDRVSLVALLCQQAHDALRAKNRGAAQHYLNEARQIARNLKIAGDSPLGRQIERVARQLQASR